MNEMTIQATIDLPDSLGAPLSGPEAALVDPHTAAIANAYERALVVTQGAHAKLREALTGVYSAAILRAIDNYAIASVALWRAAESVCDAENLPDDGEAEGITWRVPMLPTDDELGLTERQQRWNAGARIADDHFCPGCNRRGFRFLCPTCEKG